MLQQIPDLATTEVPYSAIQCGLPLIIPTRTSDRSRRRFPGFSKDGQDVKTDTTPQFPPFFGNQGVTKALQAQLPRKSRFVPNQS